MLKLQDSKPHKTKDSLLKLVEVSEDLKTESEANCIATYELDDFEFYWAWLLGLIYCLLLIKLVKIYN